MAAVTSHPADDNNTPPTPPTAAPSPMPPTAAPSPLPPSAGTPHTDDVARTTATLALAAPTGNVSSPARSTGRRPPNARPDYSRPIDVDASPVGFSPTGDVPPDALADVMMRGSYAIRRTKRDEVERAARAGSIARHVDAQLTTFLEMCTAAGLLPPVAVRVVGDVPPAAKVGRRDNRPQEIYALSLAAAATTAAAETVPMAVRGADGRRAGGQRRAGRRTASGEPATRRAPASGTHHLQPGFARRERLQAWPVLYWRCESFPSTGKSLHLFIAPEGRCFESRDDPWPLTVVGRHVRVWPADPVAIIAGMAEVDARRTALHLVHGMAHLLWRAGISL